MWRPTCNSGCADRESNPSLFSNIHVQYKRRDYFVFILHLTSSELEARAVVAAISYEAMRRTLKNELTIWRRMQRGYPPVREAAFVAPMEEVLDLYSQPYDARYPVICMDEQPKQMLSETRTPQPAQPSRPATCDYEYVRHGICTIWLFVEPLGQWCMPTPPPGAQP